MNRWPALLLIPVTILCACCIGCRRGSQQAPQSDTADVSEHVASKALPAVGSRPDVIEKSLATMDRLTLEPAPQQEGEAPDVWEGHRATIRGVAYTEDSRFVVSVSGAIQKAGAEDNSIRIWDAHSGKQLKKLDSFREPLDAVSVSPGGRFAAFGHGQQSVGDKQVEAADHDVHLWDVQENREADISKVLGESLENGTDGPRVAFKGLDSSVFSTAFSPDRKRLAAVDNTGRLLVWDTRSRQTLVSEKVQPVDHQIDEEDFGARAGFYCIRFTPDSRGLLTAGGDYMVRLFDVATGKESHRFDGHQDIVRAVATMASPDGRMLGLSGGGSRQRISDNKFIPGARDYAIRLWDLETHQELRRFTGSEGDVLSLAFCPDGRRFLSAGADKAVRLWDVATGKLLHTYRGHTDKIRSVAVSPDGRSAVSGGNDCKIRFWRLPAVTEE